MFLVLNVIILGILVFNRPFRSGFNAIFAVIPTVCQIVICSFALLVSFKKEDIDIRKYGNLGMFYSLFGILVNLLLYALV